MNKDIEEKIKNIFVNVFKELVESLKRDFEKKLKNKNKQFIYKTLLDEEVLRCLALTSSLESKVGNSLNKFLLRLLKEEDIMNHFGWLSLKEIKKFFEDKGINLDLDTNKGFSIGCCLEIPDIDLSNLKFQRKEKEENKKKLLDDLLEEKFKMVKMEGKEQKKFGVDLILITKDKRSIYLFEIKAGGDIDLKKAQTEVTNLIKTYLALKKLFGNELNIKFYFATLYNPRGEETSWKGSVGKFLDKDKILIGKDFWEFIFNKIISFEDFKRIYKDAAEESGVAEVIRDLLKKNSS